MAKIAVIGLSGESIFLSVNILPSPSITLNANDYHSEPGGKGYNQAVACKKLGAEVSFLSKIGNDEYGNSCKSYMDKLGINSLFLKDEKSSTALATILTDQNGENEVIVYPGASSKLKKEDLYCFEEMIKSADVLLIQYELPLDVIKKAIEIAKLNNTKIILNPAPAKYDDVNLVESVDIVTPNFEEAKKIFNLPNNIKMEEIGEKLKNKINNIVIITLGKNGALYVERGYFQYFPSKNVKAIDTTGAGDVFNAAIAVSIANKKSIFEAIDFAIKASAISVTKKYVIESIPTKKELDEMR